MPVHRLRTSFVFICLAAIGSLTAYAEAPFGLIDFFTGALEGEPEGAGPS